MPRYFFHIMDGHAVVDLEGRELPNVWEVRLQAIRLANEVLASEDVGLLFGQPWQMTVADTTGKTVFSLTFSANTYNK